MAGLVGLGTACGTDAVAPSRLVPATVTAEAALTRSAVVGAAIEGGLAVQVTDASGRAVPDQAVAFTVALGNGSTNPPVAVTDATGHARTEWTLGTVLGPNTVTASVAGVDAPVTFSATGTSGPIAAITMAVPRQRLAVGVDSTRITIRSLDAFGNRASPGPTIIVRDPSLISVDSNGVVRVLRRGGNTWVVASAGATSDSVRLTVLAPGESVCAGTATPIELAVGQVLTNVDPAGICVHASSPDAEYAIVPFHAADASASTISVDVEGEGLSPLTLASASTLLRASSTARVAVPRREITPDFGFERRLRRRERSDGSWRMARARDVWMSRRSARRVADAVPAALPRIGDLMTLNVNTASYCENPDLRTGRVVAITDRAIVVGDTANPPGGFTDAEYRGVGVTFDTLVDPVDRTAFGAPTDIDNNGHVIVFFTRAVNELTPPGASGVVLGYFYNRDLLPRAAGTATACPGSNEAEVMFLMVPDTGGVINSNRRSKAQAVTFASGTTSHEYEHLINAGRRLYVNGTGIPFEERWLDEGLAHVAEELTFWRASGRAPRSNLDAAIFTDTRATNAYATFEGNNILRYQTYLVQPELQAPVGADALDDDLPTRGAIWSFLRYAADRQPAGQEDAFWFRLVNSTTTGMTNLTSALGGAPAPLLHDWAISVFLDDAASGVDAAYMQPSWNMRSVLTYGELATPFPLLTHLLSDAIPARARIASNGVSFFQFAVAANQDALLTVTTRGQPLPASIQVAVVRTR